MQASTRSLIRTMLAAVVVSVPSLAHAQQVATSFTELKNQIEVGEKISVTDSAGTTLEGRLAALTNAGLDIQLGRNRSAPPLRMAEADVNNIIVKRVDSMWNGPLIGFAVGAGAGVLMELATRTQYQKFSGGGAIGLGFVSLLTGLTIDILNKDRVTVYVHTPVVR
jgi:hypothetical protein